MYTRNSHLRSSNATRLLMATLTLALAGGMAQTVAAAPADSPPGAMMGGPHPGMHGGMRGGPGMAMGEPRQMGRMLNLVNATPEQRKQIHDIMLAARKDLQTQREAGRKLHEQQRALFAAPTVDAAAVESLRQQMVAQHDQASKRMTQALLDASHVLTPEQRKTLAERMAQRRGMMERHRAERQALDPAPKR